MLESIVKKRIFHALSAIQYGRIRIQTPEGECLTFSGPQPGADADMHIQDWRVMVNLSVKGDIGFANDYRQGYWQTNDLPALLLFGLQNSREFDAILEGNWFYQQIAKLGYLTKRNTIKGSQSNIQAHYDLGNPFYQGWLDPSMTYSSALFLKKEDTLLQAQLNKYDRIIRKIPTSGRVLEIGCGWGGFAERLLEKPGYDYTGITLSKRQREYALQRLPKDTPVLLQDYRHQRSQYDAIVSIEMLEAVGQKYWPTYFRQLKRLLKPGGRAVIQTIVIADELFEQYAKGADMIRTYIFPGGMLPSVAVLQQQIQQVGLRCVCCYAFGKSYAETLQHWLNTFNNMTTELKLMGYDESFQRLWRFYLAACIATFNTERTDVVQIEICHGAEG